MWTLNHHWLLVVRVDCSCIVMCDVMTNLHCCTFRLYIQWPPPCPVLPRPFVYLRGWLGSGCNVRAHILNRRCGSGCTPAPFPGALLVSRDAFVPLPLIGFRTLQCFKLEIMMLPGLATWHHQSRNVFIWSCPQLRDCKSTRQSEDQRQEVVGTAALQAARKCSPPLPHRHTHRAPLPPSVCHCSPYITYRYATTGMQACTEACSMR